MVNLDSEQFELRDDYELIQNWFMDQGWGDGLPIVPPTLDRVERMLLGTGMPPDHIVGEIPPNYGSATVERVAINSVMAGCLPEYLPVVLAAVEAISDPAFNLYGIQATTHSCAPLVIVNGPIRESLAMNSSSGAYGPGWRSNATIGRAVRLVLLNIGGGYPGTGDMSTQGAPSKYTYCIAENEEANPWLPLHVERGFQKDESTVTVLAGEPPHNINDHSGRSAEDILTLVAGAMAVTGANNAYTGGQTLLALGPEHANTINIDGFDKLAISQWLSKHARVPLERYTHDTLMERFGRIPDGPVPMVSSSDDLIIMVLGGPGKHTSWVPTFGGSTSAVTRSISLP